MRATHSTFRSLLTLGVLLLFPPSSIFADNGQRDFTIDAGARVTVIESALTLLLDRYVSADVALQMQENIRTKLRKKGYDHIHSAAELAKTLTSDLRAVSNDKHIELFFSPDLIPDDSGRNDSAVDRKRLSERVRRNEGDINFGFRKVEILSGNVGYVNVSGFYHAEYGGDTAAATMNFLSNTDGMIIDLRENDGGRPDMVALLTSYFFDGGVVQLTGIYTREENKIHERWTLPYVPGNRYVGKNVYILTSNDTASAAEAFVYNMKVLKRAVIVGETTYGAANPGTEFRINEHFTIFIPTGRAVHPITGSNWEGTGIEPDIKSPSEGALKSAHIEALRKILEATSDEDQRQVLSKLIERRQNQP